MKPTIIIYNAGPLFNEADRKQRSLEESLMITSLMNNGYSENSYKIYIKKVNKSRKFYFL